MTDEVLQRLEDDRQKLDSQIAKLTDQRRVLDLEIARRSNLDQNGMLAGRGFTKKNERQRYFCSAIAKVLEKQKEVGLRTRLIFETIKLTNPTLSYSTLRSYLSWMQGKKLIFKRGNSGEWCVYRDWKQRLT